MEQQDQIPTSLNLDDLQELRVKSIPVKKKGKSFILREANVEGAMAYRNAISKAAKVSPDGKVISVGGIPDTEMILVCCCLYEQYEDKGDAKERQVTASQVRALLSYNEFKQLFDIAVKISGLLPPTKDDTLAGLARQIEELAKKRDELLQDGDAVSYGDLQAKN